MLRFSRILAVLFLILGIILVIYGYVTLGDPMYSISLGKNINLIWGIVMIGAGSLFGISSFLPEND
jgi:uncharacterized membrane protein HdeD (DUF308 family)